MPNTVGSIRKVVLDGVTYDAMADANVKHNRSDYEKEGVPTSGKTLVKATKRVQTAESVDLGCTTAEMEAISAKADQIADLTMSIEYADGSVYRTKGHINFEGYESETGKVSITMIPTGKWTPFLA